MVFISVQVPGSGPPGNCVSTATTLRLETWNGRLLPVHGNPASLPALPTFGGAEPGIPTATWSNWCGPHTRVVVRLIGQGFDFAQSISGWPSCTSSRSPSTLDVLHRGVMSY